MKEILRKGMLLCASTIITLFSCEAAARVLGYRFTGSTYTADPVLGWALRPGAGAWEADEGIAWSKINSHGFRDRERSLTKPEGTYRVAVLGDSLTEARQVEMNQTFTALTEEELNRQPCVPRRGVEVLNFGVPGYGTGQELLQLRDRVWKFEPDLVVLQVYAGNDIFNNYRALNVSSPDLAPYFLLKDGKLELDNRFRGEREFNPARIRMKGLAADILNQFVLLQMVNKLRLVRQQRMELAEMDARTGESASDPNALPHDYQRFIIFLPPTIPALEEAWKVTEALITEFGQEVRSHNVPLLLMIMPAAMQIEIDRAKQEEFRRRYKIDSLDYADDRIDRLARSLDIPVLRVTRPLVEEATQSGKYMAGFVNTEPNAGHMNERGHTVISAQLSRAICDLAARDDRFRTLSTEKP